MPKSASTSRPQPHRAAGPQPDKICAVVVTYQPRHDLESRLHALGSELGGIAVVDNGSSSEIQTWLQSLCGTYDGGWISNPVNLGVAAALNQGVAYALGQGYEWVLLLDQDSEPGPDFIAHLCAAYRQIADHERLAVLAPQVIDAQIGRRAPFLRRRGPLLYQRTPCRGSVLEGVTTAITSGALLRATAFDELAGFREDFFIDYVDTEFCLRLQTHGWTIAAVCAATLEHQLGARTQESVGLARFYPTHHPPSRWYTMARNRVPMLRRYALRFPHWLAYELVATTYVTIRMLLTEGQRGAKLRATLRGTWDGLRGRMGPPRETL